VVDLYGKIPTTPRDSTANFVFYLSHKYHRIDVDEPSLGTLLNSQHPVEPTIYVALLDQSINFDELLTALRVGAGYKAPAIDGLSLEFYTPNWENIRTELL
jgi:hypothetical protein